MSYDQWLEKPYDDAAKREAEFEAFCEEHDLDPESKEAWEEFEEWEWEEDYGPDPDDLRDLRYEREADGDYGYWD